MSVFKVFPVRIFPYLDLVRGDTLRVLKIFPGGGMNRGWGSAGQRSLVSGFA